MKRNEYVNVKLAPHEPSAAEQDNEAAEFYFDDEPLENILYGINGDGASVANLFPPDYSYLRKLETACGENEMVEIVATISELEESNVVLSLETCERIADLMTSIFPYYPDPVMTEDPF